MADVPQRISVDTDRHQHCVPQILQHSGCQLLWGKNGKKIKSQEHTWRIRFDRGQDVETKRWRPASLSLILSSGHHALLGQQTLVTMAGQIMYSGTLTPV